MKGEVVDLTGSSILKRIDEVLKKTGKTREYLANELNIRESTMSSWNKSAPRAVDIWFIASKLEVSVYWLISGLDEDGLKDEEREMLERYRDLEPANQNAVQKMIDSLLSVSIGEKRA